MYYSYRKNREQDLAKSRVRYRKNRETRLERAKEYREKNREKVRERDRKYREKHRERIREYHKTYRKTPSGEVVRLLRNIDQGKIPSVGRVRRIKQMVMEEINGRLS